MPDPIIPEDLDVPADAQRSTPPEAARQGTAPASDEAGDTIPETEVPQDAEDDVRALGRVPPARILRRWLGGLAVAAFLGTCFAAVSTSDFAKHLDRQVHSIHCSFIPGTGQGHGASGCRAALMSPYSSIFRDQLWGGLPISLLGLAVFAYLLFRAGDLLLRRRPASRQDTLFLLAATGFPVIVSVIYAFIAVTELQTLCKLCVGIYVSSALAFVCAVMAHRQTPPVPVWQWPTALYGRWIGEGCGFVALLALLYLAAAPSSDKSRQGCDTLAKLGDPSGVLLELGGSVGGVPAVTVLDPLCDACKGFEQRLQASGHVERLHLRTLLMPLDSSCNWMVSEAVHPGACEVSEAMLCAPEQAPAILDYAFAHQEQLLAMGRTNRGELRRTLAAAFPKVQGCVGTPRARNRLNNSLRWAVANALPVLTPQLVIGDTRLCDEDTDLGLEYTVDQLLARRTAAPGGAP